jgi:hypothetical protein
VTLDAMTRPAAATAAEVNPTLARARALDALGENEAAMRAYVDVLCAVPTHFGALAALGAIAIRTGQPIDLARARRHFETALRLEPGNRAVHRGLAILLLWSGEREAAQRHGREGLLGGADLWPYRGEGRPVSLLLVMSAVGSNVPIDHLVNDQVFQTWTLTPEFFDPSAELPPHDVVLNIVGNADSHRPALDVVETILSRTSARVLNPPESVRDTGRAVNARRLGRIPGVVTPLTEEWDRESLLASDAPDALARAGFTWPLLVRSPGFHMGQHFVKVDGPADLSRAVTSLPGASLFVIQFLDMRGADGKVRKYRAMIVDGYLYPLHLAVSSNWKVHYFSADMAGSAAHRAEDEAFLGDMRGVLGPLAMLALERVREVLGLDYGGIDFALDARGNVVVFEANATMVVPPPDEGAQWSYRAMPVRLLHHAIHRMLVNAAGCAPHSTAESAEASTAPSFDTSPLASEAEASLGPVSLLESAGTAFASLESASVLASPDDESFVEDSCEASAAPSWAVASA